MSWLCKLNLHKLEMTVRDGEDKADAVCSRCSEHMVIRLDKEIATYLRNRQNKGDNNG